MLQDRRVGHFDGKENTHHKTRCSVTGKVMMTLMERKEARGQSNEAEVDEQRGFGAASPVPSGAPLGRSTSDLSVQLGWLRKLINHVLQQLPDEVRDGHFEDATTFTRVRHQVDLHDDDSSLDGGRDGLKVSVELYKRLFAMHRQFVDVGCGEGVELVAEALEAILKLRIKRVHACLLKTHLPTVIHILGSSVAFCALQRSRRRSPAWLGVVDLSPTLQELSRQSAMLEDLMDVIVTPCDDETFAGVLQYAEKLKGQIADVVVCDGLIDDVAAALRGLRGNEQSRCVALWKILHEAVAVCTEFLSNSRPLVHSMERIRLMGLISHALVLKPPANVAVQRLAATTLHALCRDTQCLRSIIATIRSFPQAWEYLIPALYTHDISVETEVADALVLMLDAKPRDGIHDAVFREAIEHFTLAIIQSNDATALLRVASALICDDPIRRYSDGGERYFAFHHTLVRSCAKRMELRALSTRGKVPLIQYLDILLAFQCREFAALMVELDLIRTLERLVRASGRTMGVLYGVSMQPLIRLKRHFGFN